MDGGANCHVFNDAKHFILLYKKTVKCTLACGEKTNFQGIGIAIAEVDGVFIILAPSYLSTKDDVCTISPGALKRYSKCKKATHEALEYLEIVTNKNQKIRIKADQAAGLDYVKIKIHHFKRPMRTKAERNPHFSVKPKLLLKTSRRVDDQDIAEQPQVHFITRSMANRSKNQTSTESEHHVHTKACNHKHSKTNDEPAESTATDEESVEPKEVDMKISKEQGSKNGARLAYYLHCKFGHQNMDYVQKSVTKGNVKGLPKKIPKLLFDCPICKIASAPRVPRGGLVDHTEMRKGVCIHADFLIFNTVSVRKFVSAFLVKESTTRRCWGFPTRSRRPPIEIMRFVVNHLRRQGYPVNILRVDEDGALCKSSNFMKVCVEELEMVVQGTGGYNSENNGMVESPIKPIKRMIRVSLIGAGMEDTLWCVAFEYAVYLLNHRYNRMIDDLPIVKWYDGNYEFHAKQLYIFGSKVYIITKPQFKKQLQARTEKDPRDYMGLTIDESDLAERPADGYFVGYAHSSIVLAWDPKTNSIRRAHHAYIDEYNVRVTEQEVLSPNSVILQDLPPSVLDEKGVVDPKKIKLASYKLAETKDALNHDESVTITVVLPPKGEKLGISLQSDSTYGFPVMTKIHPMSPLRTQIPMDLQRNCWIIAINSQHRGHIEPITAKFCLEELSKCQDKHDDVMIEISFHRKINPVTTELNRYRSMSDQIGKEQPIVRHIVALPDRPRDEKSIFKAVQGPNKIHWKNGVKHQYNKNDDMMVLSAPIARSKLPKDVKVFPAILACRIKEKGDKLWKFEVRLCLHGGTMLQGRDFDFSYSPTIGYCPLRIVLCWTAIKGRKLSSIDVVNCFQSDSIPLKRRCYMTLPFMYKEWFDEKYPDTNYDEDPKGQYVLQTINNLQGKKDAGRSWYLLLALILNEFGFVMCIAEPALFVYWDGENSAVAVTSTDDILVSHNNSAIFGRLCVHLKAYVEITAQTNMNMLKYLNTRIIQSDLGVSFDQTHHIQTSILDKWFPVGNTEMIKSADTPYRTDSAYERELEMQLPATPTELAKLEIQYGAKYNAIIGQYNHITQVTRFDLGFTVSRLAQHNCAPKKAAFEGCKRLARFLATHLHTPIFYPSISIKMYQKIRYEYEPGKFYEQVFENLLVLFADADHARDIATRKSMGCMYAQLLGVNVDWIIGKHSCVAAHSTDAEIRSYYIAMQRNKYLRVIMDYLRMPMQGPTTIFEDNQAAVDIIQAGQITGRVKHMATYVAMIQQDTKNGYSIPQKIRGDLNPSDNGTKPNPASTFHRHFRQCRGQRYYPPATHEHGKMMQVELVSQRLTDLDTAKPNEMIDYHAMRNKMAVYDTKDANKKKEDEATG